MKHASSIGCDTMITFEAPYFRLETKELSYIFSILKTGQLEHLYFGEKLIDQDLESLHPKITAGIGSTINYQNKTEEIPLELYPLEYSGIGKGDFRLTPLEIKMPDQSFVSDFVYDHHEIIKGIYPIKSLPQAQINNESDAMTVCVVMKDHQAELEMKLIYSVFYETNVITRKVILINHHEQEITIKKIMSLMLDLPQDDYELLTFNGGWIKEAHKHKRTLSYGTYINDSTTGSSSNKHNPGIILAKKQTDESYGVCIGLNLIYSGNHYEAVQLDQNGWMRIMTGINPFCFEWPLKKGELFETPEAVLTYSNQGFNKLSQNFHAFINHHITPPSFQNVARPVALNSWEAFYFDYNHKKLITLAKQAKKLGVELFVLDDGWFGNRNNDQEGLGDYHINRKKLPQGLKKLSGEIRGLGLKFGLWFEPEMVNPKSKLYDTHQEYAIQIKNRIPALGRNQLVLDLCNPEVRAYIIDQISHILDTVTIDFIKWDMNRHITDMYSSHIRHQGMFFHTYILGLYEILSILRKKYPDILIETCSSGGNRFDLGMLAFGPQIWASDNTDPIERLKIQEGLSYLYPLSTISCHVSLAPHAQTLRATPLSTRFNVASFGVLGYELNLSYVTPIEKKEIKHQIAFYKAHRDLFQYGTFSRLNTLTQNEFRFQVSNHKTHILGDFQVLQQASPMFNRLSLLDVEPLDIYEVDAVDQKLAIERFGHLIVHALPIKIHPEGWVMRMIRKHKQLDNTKEHYIASGQMLKHGIPLKQQFSGTYYNQETRILGDFGSRLYVCQKIET